MTTQHTQKRQQAELFDAREYIGLPVVKKESDAYLLYDVDAKEIMEYAPGVYWPIRKSKALRERGTGHKVVYLGFPEVAK